jgi:hypothetical protein
VLDTVGFGAGAELVDGAGAGAELGGASVGDGDELRDPLGELEEPDELDGLGEREPLPDGLADWPARTVGRAPARTFLPWWLAAWLGVPAGDEADADGSVPVAALAALAVWAGAVRANRVAKPTAVTALSCVARQVRRDRRRSPAERVAPGASPAGPVGGSYRFCMDRDRSRAQVKGL